MSDGTAVGTPAPGIVWQRREFLLQTYGHLLGAVVAFVMLELIYFATGIARDGRRCTPVGELA